MACSLCFTRDVRCFACNVVHFSTTGNIIFKAYIQVCVYFLFYFNCYVC